MLNQFPKVFRWLSLVYLIVFLFSAFNPSSRAVWVAEILPAIGILGIIGWCSLRYRFSNTAYILMFIWLCLHTIGAKFTFSEVPCQWFNDLIGSDRNNFDRVAHFSIGLYAYPIAEYLLKKHTMKPHFAYSYALFALMAVAAGYEVIEWWYAELAGGDEGVAFLGSQGDVWDAQKDMLMDTLGALSALTLLTIQQRVLLSSQVKYGLKPSTIGT